MTPGDGDVETLDFTTDFLDGSSPRTVLMRAQPQYPEVQDSRENVLREARPLQIGYLPVVEMEFHVTDMATHHPLIAQFLSRLMDPYWTVELSLDNGTTYREIVLKRAPSFEPIGGKTVAGARMVMTVQARSPILTYPDIGSGTSW